MSKNIVTQQVFSQQSNPFGEVVSSREFLTEIETRTDFWNRTPQLQKIAWEAAQEVDISPWGMLLAVQLNMLSWIPATVVLVKRSGEQGDSLISGTSLNMYGNLVARAAGGKSTIFKESQRLLAPSMFPISDGTGQGLVKSVAETEKVTRDEDGKPLKEPYYVTRYHRHSLVIHSPEVKKLNAEFAREGSQTDSMMRSLWSGETTGMTTGDKDRRVTLIANTYRICGMWGVQPPNARAIMSGVEDGTPQRWVWAPADEWRPNVQRTTPPPNVTFPIPQWNVGQNPFASDNALPTELKDGDPLPLPVWITHTPAMTAERLAIKAARDAAREGRDRYSDDEDDGEAMRAAEMRGHEFLTTVKLAAVMGFLHGRPQPTDLDFELAKIQMEVSRAEAAGIWKRLGEIERREAKLVAVQRGTERYETNKVADDLVDKEVSADADVAWNKLATEGPAGRSALKRNCSSKRTRDLRDQAIAHLEAQGRIARDGSVFWALHRGAPLPAKMADQFRGVA